MYMQKVSLADKIPKNWFSEPDTEPKIATEPGASIQPYPDLNAQVVPPEIF